MKQDDQLVLPKPKRNPTDGELDITPMIDITFLLLAFFVVVSRMDPQASVILPKASYSESISEKNSVMVVIVQRGEGVEIYKGRTMNEADLVRANEPSGIEEEIRDYVDRELSATPNKEAILVKAEGDIKTRIVETVKKGIAKSEMGNAKPLYFGIQEER